MKLYKLSYFCVSRSEH